MSDSARIEQRRLPDRTVRLLARRFAREEPWTSALLVVLCVLTSAIGVVSHQVERRAAVELAERSVVRYGSISVGVQRSQSGRNRDVSIAGGGSWIAPEIVGAVEESAAAMGLVVGRRIEATGIASTHASETEGTTSRIVDVVAIDPTDPFRESIAAGAARSGGTAADAEPRRISIALGTYDAVTWITVPESALLADEGTTVWIDRAWLAQLMDPVDPRTIARSDPDSAVNALYTNAATNALVAGTTTDANEAFSQAYDLRERLATADLSSAADGADEEVVVSAWPELAGRSEFLGTGGSSRLLRPLALLVAFISIGGLVAVAIRNRDGAIAMLRTLGLGVADVRGVVVTEVAAAAIGCALAAFVLLTGLRIAGVTFLGVPLLVDAATRRLLLAVAVVPPGIAFLVARRELRAPVAQIAREHHR